MALQIDNARKVAWGFIVLLFGLGLMFGGFALTQSGEVHYEYEYEITVQSTNVVDDSDVILYEDLSGEEQWMIEKGLKYDSPDYDYDYRLNVSTTPHTVEMPGGAMVLVDIDGPNVKKHNDPFVGDVFGVIVMGLSFLFVVLRGVIHIHKGVRGH